MQHKRTSSFSSSGLPDALRLRLVGDLNSAATARFLEAVSPAAGRRRRLPLAFLYNSTSLFPIYLFIIDTTKLRECLMSDVITHYEQCKCNSAN